LVFVVVVVPISKACKLDDIRTTKTITTNYNKNK
jgi:hypothetical protein